MPRLPVDGKKVIEHRISLSGVEREQLENFVMGYNVNRVMTPLVALLSDVTALGALYLLLNSLFPNWAQNLPSTWRADTAGMSIADLDDYLELQNIVGMTVGGLAGGAVAGPAGAVAGGLLGTTVVEGLEYVVEPGFVERMMLGLRLLTLNVPSLSGSGLDMRTW